MKNEILHLLKKNKDNFISGQSISDKLGVSRTAIWKYINAIKEDGYIIESASKKGYKLLSSPDLLNFEEVNETLNTKYLGKNIEYFNTINSTNTKAKELASNDAVEGTVIISEEQTDGKGRLGRHFISPKFKGVWMSLILRPDIEPMNVPKITQIAAASVVNTCESLGINVYVKWPNDIILNGKKICGILTEMSGELNKVNYVIVGLGINANLDLEDFPQELKNLATSLSYETGKTICRKLFVSTLLNNFEKLYDDFIKNESILTSIQICRTNSILINKEVKIINRGKETICKAVDIDEDGSLIVELKNGTIHKIISGEISVRGINGYI